MEKDYQQLKKDWRQAGETVISEIIQLVTTGEVEIANLRSDQDIELRDVLACVLDDFDTYEQDSIFSYLLENTDTPKRKYIQAFLEAHIEDAPFDISCILAFKYDSATAQADLTKRFAMDDFNIDFTGDLSDDEIKTFLECIGMKYINMPEAMEWMERKCDVGRKFPYEAACAYYDMGEYESALRTLLKGPMDGESEDLQADILNDLKADYPEDYENVLKRVGLSNG